jgi:hypothetical protein
MFPASNRYMLIVWSNQVVSMLTFGHAIVNEPCYHYLSCRFLLAIVNGFEYASTPSAIALDPIPVTAFVRSGMAEEALRTDVP